MIIINLNINMLMSGQNSLKNTYGKSRLLEKKEKEKRTLMKSNIIKKILI